MQFFKMRPQKTKTKNGWKYYPKYFTNFSLVEFWADNFLKQDYQQQYCSVF